MTEPGTKIVPFGKYKGQPVEAMVQDRNYVEWLTAQPWFKEKFHPIYNVVINNFGEPSETPEHNAIQALFLSNQFRYAFLSILLDDFRRPTDWITNRLQTEVTRLRAAEQEHRIESERFSTRAYLSDDGRARGVANEMRMAEEASTHAEKYDAFLRDGQLKVSTGADFESEGADVRLWWKIETSVYVSSGLLSDSGEVRVEIKPTLADDYPAVLRQMKRNGSTALLIESYCGVGATAEQVKQIFGASRFAIISRGAVDRRVAETAAPDQG